MCPNEILPIFTPPHCFCLFHRRVRSVVRVRHRWRVLVNVEEESRVIIIFVIIIPLKDLDFPDKIVATKLPLVLEKKVAGS